MGNNEENDDDYDATNLFSIQRTVEFLKGHNPLTYISRKSVLV